MQKECDNEHPIAIVVCSECGKETPLSHVASLSKEGHPDIEIWSTPCCDIVPFDESVLRGYVSIKELEDMGWMRDANH